MKTHFVNLPITPESITKMQKGDKVLLNGTIYTARDQAHKRLMEAITMQGECPIPLSQTAIFYCGPSPVPEGKVCGAIGPTTSSRMDAFTPSLLEAGLRVMIGKGDRAESCLKSIRDCGAVYLSAIGGASAVLSRCIVSCETFLWDDLGAEAVYKLEVIDLPCYVAYV